MRATSAKERKNGYESGCGDRGLCSQGYDYVLHDDESDRGSGHGHDHDCDCDRDRDHDHDVHDQMPSYPRDSQSAQED